MTDTSSSPQAGVRVPTRSSVASREPTAWVGWIVFAAVMMIMIGALHAIQGLIALFKDNYYLVPNSRLVVSVDYTTWGWVHIIAGLLVAGTGAALFTGRVWARVLGVILVGISMLVNFAFVQAYPIWSLILITMDVLVIYALIVHGREIADV